MTAIGNRYLSSRSTVSYYTSWQ